MCVLRIRKIYYDCIQLCHRFIKGCLVYFYVDHAQHITNKFLLLT
uniref:Uncharacterized protein n=1 Tax=Rhizophora mucronata TaxID=61149 RepID=A0A2P2IT29_RHIMU